MMDKAMLHVPVFGSFTITEKPFKTKTKGLGCFAFRDELNKMVLSCWDPELYRQINPHAMHFFVYESEEPSMIDVFRDCLAFECDITLSSNEANLFIPGTLRNSDKTTPYPHFIFYDYSLGDISITKGKSEDKVELPEDFKKYVYETLEAICELPWKDGEQKNYMLATNLAQERT